MLSKFFLDGEGNYSNSRLIADVIIVNTLLMVYSFIWIGTFKPEVNLLGIATAISVLFGSVAGASLAFLFFQKKEEGIQLKESLVQKKVENKIEASIDKK